MKDIILINLSDIHIDSTFDYNSEAIYIVNSIDIPSTSTHCFLLLSGDLARHGRLDEYAIAKNFIDKIVVNLKEKTKCTNIEVLIVPGNHDLNFNGIYRERSDIDMGLEDTLKLQSELDRMNEFFIFAGEFDNFAEDKYVDFKSYKKDSNIINFILVNSALFSVYSKTKDTSIGLHYIPDHVFQKIEEFCHSMTAAGTINIFMMHHTVEWFQPSVKQKLSRLLSSYSSLVINGHVHDPNTIEERKSGRVIKKIDGGFFNDQKSGENNFYWCILQSNLHLRCQKCQKNGDIYIEMKPIIELIIDDNKRGNKAVLHEDSILRILDGYVYTDRTTLLDYYVFPELTQIDKYIKGKNQDFDKKTRCLTYQDFIKSTADDNEVSIIGSSGYGKSILLHYLFYNSYRSNQTPIIINASTLKELDKSKYSKLIKDVFNDLYITYDFFDYEHYNQLHKSDKVIYIDDANIVQPEKLNDFLDFTREKFGRVVFAIDKDVAFDYRRELTHAIRVERDEINSSMFEIRPFFRLKRREFAYKYLQYKKMEQKEIDLRISIMETIIDKQLVYIDQSPKFITLLIDNMTADEMYTPQGNDYNSLYDRDITNKLTKGFSESDEIEYTKIIIECLAYDMHFTNRSTRFSEDDIFSHIDSYNRQYDGAIVKSKFLSHLLKTKIICYREGSYHFSDKKTRAYFTALSLFRKFNEIGNIEIEMTAIFNELFKDINVDVLMFLAFITRRLTPLSMLFKMAKDFFDIHKENVFTSDKLKKFDFGYFRQEIEAPTIQDIEKQDEILESIERKSSEAIDKHNQINDEFELTDQMKDIKKALNYISVIAHTLSSFSPSMKFSDKREYVRAVYYYPNILLGMILKPLFDGDIKDDFEKFESQEKEKPLSEIIIEFNKLTKSIAIKMIYEVYKHTAFHASTKNSFLSLDKFEDKNQGVYEIQNLLMASFVEKPDVFYDRAKKMIEKSKLEKLLKHYILHCVFDFIVYAIKTKKDIASLDRFVDTFFSESKGGVKKNLLAMRKE
ncbi:MAG TPA: metallophosphoesterase [Acholeplasmataceae bacterium]|nr:metallophosphoesterase [Acholeplasmataceae bacterium]